MDSAHLVLEERDANGNFSKAFYDNALDAEKHLALPGDRRSSNPDPLHDLGRAPSRIVEVSANDKSVYQYLSIGGRRPSSSRVLRVLQFLISVFLPTGYPDSVTSDYVDYQIFDSIQAFASTIAALIGNRAVLTAVGVGDKNATSTSAMFITGLQETLGRLATISFAWKYGSTLEQECKKFRFVADLVYNAGVICDVCAPYFGVSRSTKIFFLCCSGVLKAVCGVMANGSRAALTQHFTDSERGSISDVSAKDASQETVISLMGMLVGAIIVPYVNTDIQIWTTLLLLITVHLTTNYWAVTSVVMDTLNRQRVNIVFAYLMDQTSPLMLESDLLDHQSVLPSRILSPKEVVKQERVLERDGLLRWGSGNTILGHASIGSFSEVYRILPSGMTVNELLHLFGDGKAGYVLWFEHGRVNGRKGSFVTVRGALIDVNHADDEDYANSDAAYYGVNPESKEAAETDTRELRAWVHALYLAKSIRALHHGSGDVTSLTAARDHVRRTLKIVDGLFDSSGLVADALRLRGWDLSRGRTMVVSGSVPRISVRGHVTSGER
ncbi:vitamin B6 photo-protection and homoeostasis-domain-containing protein [Myxozyma melibiosi]|uniref:Vitamin B6 photo-protection and homoeostasis-domain-containing protein n=1 Tax=Myxozyma melibiosi TaxID=54550 RepID=A0ABR1FF04_9ASCO